MVITISTKKYQSLPCQQSAGQGNPRIVNYQALDWAVVSDTGRPVLRPADRADYEQNTIDTLAARADRVQADIARTRQI